MKLPDITPEEIKGDVIFLFGLAATFGFKFDGDLSNGLTAVAVAGFTLVKVVNDVVGTWRRKNRAANADKIAQAQKILAEKPPVTITGVTATPTRPPKKAAGK